MARHGGVLTDEDDPAMPDDGRRHEILDGEVAVSAWRRQLGDVPIAPVTRYGIPDLVLGLHELWPRPSTGVSA